MKARGKALASITSNLRALLRILAPVAILAALFLATQLPSTQPLFNTVQPEPDSTATLTRDCGPEWNIVSSPNVTDEVDTLSDLAIISDSDIWAVGWYQGQPMTQHWDGNYWSVVPGPADVQIYGVLYGVAAVATDDVWAVGSGGDGVTQGALIEHWDGSSWQIVASPGDGKSKMGLQDVAVVSADDVWAVGTIAGKTLAIHWNGDLWNIVPSPQVPSNSSYLQAVAAVASNDVWAVGRSHILAGNTADALETTLILHWNGNEWSIVPSPNGDRLESSLWGVAAVSANDVWAVGLYDKDVTTQTPIEQRDDKTALPVRNTMAQTVIAQPLIEHWDGNRWSIVPSLDTDFDSRLYSVMVISANDVWGVGYRYSGNGLDQLLAQWNGTSWSIVDSPNIGSHNRLHALAAISADNIWAVGSMNRGERIATLVERYSTICTTPISIPLVEATPSITPEVTLTPTVETTPTAYMTPVPALSTPTLEMTSTPTIEVTVVTTLTPEATETSIVASPINSPTVEVIGEVTSTPTLEVIQVPTLYPPITPIDLPTIQVVPLP